MRGRVVECKRGLENRYAHCLTGLFRCGQRYLCMVLSSTHSTASGVLDRQVLGVPDGMLPHGCEHRGLHGHLFFGPKSTEVGW